MCYHCSRITVDRTRFKYVQKQKIQNMEIEFSKSIDHVPGSGDQKQFLSAQKAVEIFWRMKEDNVKALGMDVTHACPKWMLVTVLPVPPLHVWPSVQMPPIAPWLLCSLIVCAPCPCGARKRLDP